MSKDFEHASFKEFARKKDNLKDPERIWMAACEAMNKYDVQICDREINALDSYWHKSTAQAVRVVRDMIDRSKLAP